MFELEPCKENVAAQDFCRRFVGPSSQPRFVLGRNDYARSIISVADIAGVIDDFTTETEFCGRPVLKMHDVPRDGLVVSSMLGKPRLGARVLSEHGLTHLDYFAFSKYSGLDIAPVTFWNEFHQDFYGNNQEYQWIHGLLRDERSRETLSRIIHFRLYRDLRYMSSFTNRQELQYFEDFLGLSAAGEVFVDVGGYDGNTSLEFVKRCPHYRSIHLFEPDRVNLAVAKERLASCSSVYFYPSGLSDRRRQLSFEPDGSCGRITESGSITIDVDRLDDVVHEEVSFIKMDIEGAESAALAGARGHVASSCPRLAICVYHKCDDLWTIPQQVLAMRSDYDVYLRHYSEGVDETVMFFVPS